MLSAEAAIDFDAGLQRMLVKPEGAELRSAYLLQQFAQRIYRGDYQKASEALDRTYSSLGDRSPRDVAATDAGMLMIRDLLAEMEWHARYRKLDALYQSREDGATRELTLLLDLLPLAWGMNDPEFEELLKVPNNWLRLWQDHKVEVGPQRERLLRLRRLFDAFRAILRPRDLAAAWHSAWNAESPIGERSLLQAFQEDGDVALDRIELYLWGLAERDLSR